MDVLLISQYKYKYGFNWKSLGCIKWQMKSIGRICFILFVRRKGALRGISSLGNEEEWLVSAAPWITIQALLYSPPDGVRGAAHCLCTAAVEKVEGGCWLGESAGSPTPGQRWWSWSEILILFSQLAVLGEPEAFLKSGYFDFLAPQAALGASSRSKCGLKLFIEAGPSSIGDVGWVKVVCSI